MSGECDKCGEHCLDCKCKGNKMGCGYEIACKTCKKHWDLGYGSYSTWIIELTVGKFIEKLKKDIDLIGLKKNQNILSILMDHDEHELIFWNEDYAQYDKSNIRYCYDSSCDIMIEDIDSYEYLDMEKKDGTSKSV